MDTCRRTKKGRPRGGSVTINFLPAVPEERPEAGSIVEKTDFHDVGVNSILFMSVSVFRKKGYL
jgi:hypothetical protein